MKETFYFSHDYTARTDAKIRRLIAQHGMAGYGIYWAIIEDLYNNANAMPTDYDCIAYDLRTDATIIDSIINDFGLFVNNGKTFMSTSVERRLIERKHKSEKARKSALNRWNNANAMRSQCDGNAIKESKVKEKKVNNIFIIPTVNDIKLYCQERNNKVDAEQFFNFYSSKGWMVGKNKMKDWKSAVRTWEKNALNNNTTTSTDTKQCCPR